MTRRLERPGRLTKNWSENRRLQAQIQKLLRLVEQLRRDGKGQAAPFRSRTSRWRSPRSRGAGRVGGMAHMPITPPRIDETYDVPLPTRCRHCGARQLSETHVAVPYQAEISRTVIYRQFDVHWRVRWLRAHGRRPSRVANLDGPRRGQQPVGPALPRRAERNVR